MADFFEDLGKKISDIAGDIGKKAEETIEIEKLRSRMRSLKRANERDLMEIGRMVYDKFRDGEVVDFDYTKQCEEIEKRDEETEKCKEEISRIQGV